MVDQVLPLVICGLPIFIITVGAAIIGITYRRKLATRINVGIREGRFKDFSGSKMAKKIRLFSLLSLFSILGVILIFSITLIGISPVNSKLSIALYILFILICSISGTFLLREVVNRLK